MAANEYAGQTALVTGASSGIGRQFAIDLAARGADIVLLARTQSKLEELASELRERSGSKVEVITSDLSKEWASREIANTLTERGLRVDILVNNAGFGTYGDFASVDAGKEHDEVMLNVTSVVDLCHEFLPAMIGRGQGAIVNVASTAGFQPVPQMAVYGATKAFVLSFTEALHQECRGKGVKVLALCPGATRTEFFNEIGAEHAVGQMADPQAVVAKALSTLAKNRPYKVIGMRNYLLANSARTAPRSLVAKIAGRAVSR